jgi:hypothetical protein
MPPPASLAAEAPRPILLRPEARAPRAVQADVTVPAGTRIGLALRNAVDTKHSREGDRIYLETIYPVAAGGQPSVNLSDCDKFAGGGLFESRTYVTNLSGSEKSTLRAVMEPAHLRGAP